jgi:hypothetical protein
MGAKPHKEGFHRDRRQEAEWLERVAAVKARGGQVEGFLDLTRPMWRERLKNPEFDA